MRPPRIHLLEQLVDRLVEARPQQIDTTDGPIAVDQEGGGESTNVVPLGERTLTRVAVIPVRPGDPFLLHHPESGSLVAVAVDSEQGERLALVLLSHLSLVGNLHHARATPGTPKDEHND